VWIVWTSAANASVVCGRGEDVERGKRVGRSSRIWSTSSGSGISAWIDIVVVQVSNLKVK
jgi:hypothetical protein